MRFIGPLLDTLFPKHPLEKEVAHIRTLQPTLHTSQHGSHAIQTLLSYAHEDVKRVIRAVKFHRSTHAASLCADVLLDAVLEAYADIALFNTSSHCIITAVPLGRKRLRERGYNQVSLILETLIKDETWPMQITYNPHILTRMRETKPQTTLSKAERLKNVAGAFAIHEKAPAMQSAHIFLIDDVMTTGATLLSAARPLQAAGAHVHPIAIARAGILP